MFAAQKHIPLKALANLTSEEFRLMQLIEDERARYQEEKQNALPR
jgi:hypothetical protein